MKTLLLCLFFSFSASASLIKTNWNYASVTPITNTTPVSLVAAPVSAIPYVTGLQIFNTSVAVSSLVIIKKGSTVLWVGYAPATTAALQIAPLIVDFITPIKGDISTALTIEAGTTGSNIYVSAQGFIGL